MPRPPSAVLWLATLASGVALGLALGQRLPAVNARPGPASDRPASTAPVAKVNDEDAQARELAETYDKIQALDRAFQAVARSVAPSVVHIVARKRGPRDDGADGPYEETGSGVIVRDATTRTLHVLTNNHVVEGAVAGDISIHLHDGQVLRPERYWADSKADVAVLKLTRDDLPAAHLGDSDDARVGTWVLALGSPFGLTHSVSQGIISARGRHEEELEFDGVEHQEFLQTDAAINPGNSGGPLVNLKGEVIGINTAIASEGGGSEGVGFSIPINLAKWAMSQLVTRGKVLRGAIGVNLQSLNHAKALELGLGRPRGARVVTVHDESPAAKAGILAEDVILKFNGVEVIDHNHLINLVSICPIGQTAEVVVWRAKAALLAKVSVADREIVMARVPTGNASAPNDAFVRRPARTPEPRPDPAELGLSLATIDGKTAARYYPRDQTIRGVMIARIDPNSPLAPYLKPLDVLLKVRDQPIRSADDALKALVPSPDGSATEVTLQRIVDGVLQKRTVRIP